ncbi:MAG: serine/threonine-protein kinase [Thermoflexales bacterium]
MPERLGSYILLNPIAKGGMAMVYRAVHEPTGREVAIKVLSPSLAADVEYISRFLREAKTLMDLRHPNIVQVFEANAAQGQYFISMELLGETLFDSMAKLRAAKQVMPQAKALLIARQIASALGFAHEKALVHRDVKPSNVLIAHDPGGRTRHVLSDFGVVKDTGATRLTHAEMTIGTPAYMSPEQLLTPGKIDHRSDLYSLGMILYEMLSGISVYEGMTPVALMYHIAHEPLPPIMGYRADLTRATREILDTLLSKKVETRYQTARDVIDAIDRALEQKEKRSRVLPLLLITGASLLCCAGFLAVYLGAQGISDANANSATPTRPAGPAVLATNRPVSAGTPAPVQGTTGPAANATSTLVPDGNQATPQLSAATAQATPTPTPLLPGPTSTLSEGPTNAPAGPGATATPTPTPTRTPTGTPSATSPPPTSPPPTSPPPTSPPATSPPATSPPPTSPPPTSPPPTSPPATSPPPTVPAPTSTPPKLSTAPPPTPVPVITSPPPAG